ncbi:DUF4440 domain-containing protein [Rhodoferax sp.]|uniref:nuclear transport factor 2 family protein n=1 Tax=Rhodoferax sp. TaxID=50421 RepID=UPI00276CBB99|nr:DUF4440 domain-containing protein [Rhodoferax sp.]
MSNPSIANTLRALECELHDPSVRRNRNRLVQLIHPDFLEFGRSGASYAFADILERLPSETEARPIHAQGFAAHQLVGSVFLLTYKSAHVSENGELERHTLRSSIWRLEPAGWQMVFHQGTPTAAFDQRTEQTDELTDSKLDRP